ncbi:tetratricopeptide repeat protein, partial [Oxalobacteraceae bacterium OM1]
AAPTEVPALSAPAASSGKRIAREAAQTPDQDETKSVPAITSMRKSAAPEATKAPAEAVEKHIKDLSPQQRAENEYRKAVTALQQGHLTEAISGLESTLQIDARHAAARQALIGALVDAGRTDEAIRKAKDALAQDPAQAGVAMVLARLQLEKGELPSAIGTMERSLPYSADRSDYQAFLAALLQRAQRHKEAVEHYFAALRIAPQNGVWWMGTGISLQADGRNAEAREAFKRAKATGSLSPDLSAFVDTRLAQLGQQ